MACRCSTEADAENEATRTLDVGRFPIRVAVLPGGEKPDGMAWVSGGVR